MLAREVPTSPTNLRERACRLKAEIGYLDPAKARATGLLVEIFEKRNAATEKHPENEVDPFSYLVHGCLHVPPTMAQFSPFPAPVRKVLVPWVFFTGSTRVCGSMLAVKYGKYTAGQWSVKELFAIARVFHPPSRAKQFELYSQVSKFNLLAAPH